MATFVAELSVPGKGIFKASFDTSKTGRQWSQFWLGSEAIAGCHAYVTPFRGGIYRVDMRVSNGSVKPDGSGFCGKIYFTSLDVRGPRGFDNVNVPRFGEKTAGSLYNVIQPLPGTQKHVLLPRAAFMRTFVLAPMGGRRGATGILNRDGLKMPDPVKNFGPLGSTFPKIDRAASEAVFWTRVGKLRGALASGAKRWEEQFMDLQPPIGYVRLDGEASAGAPAGYGIELSQADCQTHASFVYHEHMAQLVMEGRNYSCYHRDTGEPIRCVDWTTPMHEQRIDGWGRLENPAFLDASTGEYQYRVYNPQYEGTCPYEYDGRWTDRATGVDSTPPADMPEWERDNKFFFLPPLADIEAIDTAHLIRAMKHLLCVVGTTGELWARDELSMLHAHANGGEWSGRADEKVVPDYAGQWIFPTLQKKVYDAHQKPHVGSWLERSFGWYMLLSAAMLKLFPARDDIKADALKLMDVAVTAADPFGITANAWYHVSDEYFPAPWSGTQAFHSQYVIHGLYALALQRAGGIPPEVRDVITRGTRTLGGTFQGLPKWIGLARDWVHITNLMDAYRSAEQDPAPWAALNSGAICYRMTGDKAWLEMVKGHWLGAKTLAELKSKLDGQSYLGLGGEMQGVL